MAHWMQEPKDEESLVGINKPGQSTNCEFFVKLIRNGLSMAEHGSKWIQHSDVIENGLAARLRSGLEAMVRNPTIHPSTTQTPEQTIRTVTIQGPITKYESPRDKKRQAVRQHASRQDDEDE